jgi:hypothetical protein
MQLKSRKGGKLKLGDMKKVDYDKEDRQAIKLRRTRRKQMVRDR